MRKSKLAFVMVAIFLSACQPKAIQDPACRKTYMDLYRGDTLDVRVLFGYKDARPARFVGDRYELTYFIQKLLKQGFSRAPGHESTFVRAITGPDGKRKTIVVQVSGSSASPDDEENRRDPFQKSKTQTAENAFQDGLRQADVVFYDGHSRDGGGPDFGPPRLAAGKYVDYGWYRAQRPGRAKMLMALRQAETAKPGGSARRGPRLIGLFSCASDQHFSRDILRTSPKSGLIGSDQLLYYADALDDMAQTMQNLTEMKCEADFSPSGTRTLGLFD